MRIYFVTFVLSAASVLLSHSATSKPAPTDPRTTEVERAEAARTKALVADDLGALDQILADDLTYVHASGKVDTKKSLMDSIRSGQVHYMSWDARNLNIRLFGDIAVVNGEYFVHVTDKRVQEQPLNVDILILTVYAHRNGRWQQVAWQSTRQIPA